MKVFFSLFLLSLPHFSVNLQDEQFYHRQKVLTSNSLVAISKAYNETYLKTALNSILVPRVVGSENHQKVREFITSSLQDLGWYVEPHRFEEKTPNLGVLRFTNIIAKLKPEADRYLTLACHYDSKYFPEHSKQTFVGATDSAVPCAMLLTIANALKEKLLQRRNSDLSLMLVFFDGEEAFQDWNSQDSLYGARNLASTWDLTPRSRSASDESFLESIDVLVLLDLIGARNPVFYSQFRNTLKWHSLMVDTEGKLRQLRVINPALPSFFKPMSSDHAIEDDHIPFLRRGVPILHLIPIPFPKVWHTLKDNYNALDFPTIKAITQVVQAFVVSYLHL